MTLGLAQGTPSCLLHVLIINGMSQDVCLCCFISECSPEKLPRVPSSASPTCGASLVSPCCLWDKQLHIQGFPDPLQAGAAVGSVGLELQPACPSPPSREHSASRAAGQAGDPCQPPKMTQELLEVCAGAAGLSPMSQQQPGPEGIFLPRAGCRSQPQPHLQPGVCSTRALGSAELLRLS